MDGLQTRRPLVPSLFVVIGPLAVVSFLLAATCGGALWDCAAIWHDEVWYWNEIAVFNRAGWDGGYTVTNERTARTPFIHFGAHGPFFPAFYGVLTRATGLHYGSIPMLNAALLLVGSTIWALTLRRPSEDDGACSRQSSPMRFSLQTAWSRQNWAAVLVVLSFWPIVLYLPTSMQEVLHYAIAFILAAAVVWQLRAPASLPRLLTLVFVTVVVAQIRVTWCWLALPLLWVAIQPRHWHQWALWIGLGMAIVGPLYYQAIVMYAPFPNFMGEVLDRLSQSPIAAIGHVAKHVVINVCRYVAPTRDTWLQNGLRYQTLMIAGAAIYHLIHRRKPASSSSQVPPQNAGTQPTATAALPVPRRVLSALIKTDEVRTATIDPTLVFGFVLLNLACIVGFVVAFYDVFDWRDYRVIAPHLLLSLLVLVGGGARQWLGGYAVVSLILALFVPFQFAEFHRQRVAVVPAKIDAFAKQISPYVPFEPARNGWDNTLLMHIDHLNSPLLMGLPPGIGISIAYRWNDQPYPPLAKYVLLTKAEIVRLGAPALFRHVATTPLGELYQRRADVTPRQVADARAAARNGRCAANRPVDSRSAHRGGKPEHWRVE